MSSQTVPYVTPEEYLKFDRASEIKHEYVFGEIVTMTAGTYNHGLIAANTIYTLRSQSREQAQQRRHSNLRPA